MQARQHWPSTSLVPTSRCFSKVKTRRQRIFSFLFRNGPISRPDAPTITAPQQPARQPLHSKNAGKDATSSQFPLTSSDRSKTALCSCGNKPSSLGPECGNVRKTRTVSSYFDSRRTLKEKSSSFSGLSLSCRQRQLWFFFVGSEEPQTPVRWRRIRCTALSELCFDEGRSNNALIKRSPAP